MSERAWPKWMTAEIQKRIDNRDILYIEAFKKFRENTYMTLGTHQSGLLMNAAILRVVVERYFEDLEKDRLENRCALFNGYRQAAFTIKWFMRLRPIQTTANIAAFIRANEDFALLLALTHLERSPDNIDPFFHQFFLYTLRYDQPTKGQPTKGHPLCFAEQTAD